MKKKVSINEKKNTIFYFDDLLYHQEILDIILDYFTNFYQQDTILYCIQSINFDGIL